MPLYGSLDASPKSNHSKKNTRTSRARDDKPLEGWFLPPIKGAAKPGKKEPLPRLMLARAPIAAMPAHANHFQRVAGGWRPLPATLNDGVKLGKSQLVTSVVPPGMQGRSPNRKSITHRMSLKQLKPNRESLLVAAGKDSDDEEDEQDAWRRRGSGVPLNPFDDTDRQMQHLIDVNKEDGVHEGRRTSSKDHLLSVSKSESSARNGSKGSQMNSKERPQRSNSKDRLLERKQSDLERHVERKQSKEFIPMASSTIETDDESVRDPGSKEPTTHEQVEEDDPPDPFLRKRTKREEAVTHIREMAKESLGRGLYDMGFTDAELEEFFWLFAMFDQDHGCSMSVNEVRTLLRYLGQSVSSQRIHSLLEGYDEDKSGEIDICEFLNFMQDFRQSEHELMTGAFQAYDPDHTGEISIQDLGELLGSLGREPTIEQMKILLKDFDADKSGTIDLEEFMALGKHYTQMERKLVMKNAGFSEEEVQDFRAVFAFCDGDRSGHLNFKELIQVLEMIGNLPRTKEQQERLVEMMHHYDEDDSGSLAFEEFLHLMRKFMDEDECIEYVREKAAMDRIGLSMLEVQEFRDIFESMQTQVGTGDDDFTFSSARTLVRSLGVNLDMEQNSKLKMLFQKYASKIGPLEVPEFEDTESQQPVYHSLLFPDFLLFVGQLISEDFAGVRSSSLKVVASRESEEQKLSALVNEVHRQKEASEANKSTKSEVLHGRSNAHVVDLH